ncbi:hypothetical protein OKW43_001230 [Paraburkholderia sp. WC7.3g]|uniref:hypothetical protein n=1 Tax=Paraburkholderia sp. WC7.3g TaxID=2991070 RepID=UPI003D20F407
MLVDGAAIDMVPSGMRAIESSQSAFVPVVSTPPSTLPTSSPQSTTLALHVCLSNDVEFDLSNCRCD